MKRVIFLFCLLSQPTIAEDYTWVDQCDTNQLSMNTCAFEEFKVFDKELNELYKIQMEHLRDDGKSKPSLKKAQRAWIKFRNLDCRYMSGDPNDSGSMWSLTKNKCLTSRTKTRIQELKSFIACRENGCPWF